MVEQQGLLGDHLREAQARRSMSSRSMTHLGRSAWASSVLVRIWSKPRSAGSCKRPMAG